MKAKDKENFIKELREILSKVNVDELEQNPQDGLLKQKFFRAKAIIGNFDHGTGKKMGELMFGLQNPLRSKKEIDARGLRNWLTEKIEEMDVYEIEDIAPSNKVEKIKRVLEDENLKVQSNIDGEDEHIFIFDKTKENGGYVHLIRDGGTGEMRIDPKDRSPHELITRVETILTTKAGQKIRSTLNTLEFFEEEVSGIDTPILDLVSPVGRSGGPQGHYQTFCIKNLSANKTAIDCNFVIRGFGYEWQARFKDPVSLAPQETKDVIYKISNERTFKELVNELNFVMEFSDTSSRTYHTRRDLKQDAVESGAFFELNVGKFHKVTQSIDDKLQSMSYMGRNGVLYEMLFSVGGNGAANQITICVSDTFVACWGFSGEREIKQALTELGHRKIRKMIRDKDIKPSYTFVTTDFPNDYQSGWTGYVRLRDSLV